MSEGIIANPAEAGIALKVLLRQRHLQGLTAFIKEYNKLARDLDRDLVGSGPSKAQFYRWLSGDVRSLPYAHHCRILEAMFPGWTAEQLFAPYEEVKFAPAREATGAAQKPEPSTPAAGFPTELVAYYPHRAEVANSLWMDLLAGASKSIDLFANASLFLPEDNPDSIGILKEKAASGTRVRILLADPNDPAMDLRGREERLFEAIPARIKMALAYYRPLVDVEGVEFRTHGTALYNSIFRYDDQMLINQHVYGTYGYMAPIMHLRRSPGADLFDMYMKSFELVWQEEATDIREANIW